MPKVMLEHMRLRDDPLKDAAGFPFGKADRLHLYVHVQKLCRVGKHQHRWDIIVHYVKILHIQKM